MAGPDSRDPAIPEWQRQSGDPAASPEQSSSDNGSSRAALLDQAAKFLQDESIRDAPADRKIAFLESKGLQSDEIQKLLGVGRNPAATNDARPEATEEPNSKPSESTIESLSHQKSRDILPPSQSSTAPPSTTSSSSSSRDVPPIITYPEFLLQPRQPPLVSLRSVLYALYGAAGLGASFYGASEFLVKPMIKSLTSARHELAETAQQNLKKLNEKLEKNVSTIPPYPSRHTSSKTSSDAGEDSTQDAESITSDPTELFHRDIATQTTPDLALGANRSSYFGPMDENEEKNDPTKAVTGHLKRLEILTSHLREFVEDEQKSKTGDDAVRDRLNELHTYLDSLTYLNNPVYNIYGGGDYARSTGSSGRGVRQGEEDAISTFKAEIRSVKGALLSARNFPSGRTAIPSMSR
ncbi:hypothetical protein VTN96DRAFT_8518 [Rasamsonia emersonii]|uniref:Peroxisomal membrane protein PEX14 n=1 Tax=Rasamsonia emersonii (strain ATCC 16479 / CBS 393.64 / IMI 116815) TaxID=1408163 RepID=A0A0F4YRB1_RASE3|nr:Peroxisomal membrane anchor protein [Rasamsonia emersonii CBS 393.64]KKA20784.1 Peroxisomal membrane anchor protein [Rasamsonia emersonii CBS 393.64]